MKRICIFSFFDNDGIVDEYIEYYLNEISQIVKRIVIVVNGNIKNDYYKKLLKYTDEIIVRENKGYDAGAYKQCMFDYIGVEKLKEYDEIVLSNDTCFGPFISFSEIFSDMSKCKCDFWGMKRINKQFYTHIQSWFMVFRKNIIQDNNFYAYWNEYIDENCTDIGDIYSLFEVGIFRKLQSLGYIAGVYHSRDNINSYTSSYWGLKYGEVFLKKKVLDRNWSNEVNLNNSIRYIHNMYNYDLSLVDSVAKRKFNFYINSSLYTDDYEKQDCEFYDYIDITGDEILNVCSRHKDIYIYGAGIVARHIYYFLKENGLQVTAFLVSDITDKKAKLCGVRISQWKFEKIKIDDVLIVGMNKKNTEMVYRRLENVENLVLLYNIR